MMAGQQCQGRKELGVLGTSVILKSRLTAMAASELFPPVHTETCSHVCSVVLWEHACVCHAW